MPVLQCTLSGIDGSGFSWQNVFHIQADLGLGSFYQLLIDTASLINADLVPQYQAAANDQIEFLDIGVKGVGADASYSYHQKIAVNGTRVVTAALGAVCPLIRFLPDSGTIVGGLYAVGAGVADFVLDEIQPAYQGMLDNIATAMLGWDGSLAPHHFQLVTYNSRGPVITPMKHKQTPTRPTTLNKRIRA